MQRYLYVSLAGCLAALAIAGCQDKTAPDAVDTVADLQDKAGILKSPPPVVETASAAAENSYIPKVEPQAVPADLAGKLCRAAIASLMSHDPSIIKVIATAPDHIDVRYTASDDPTVWTNRCHVSADRIEWAMIENGQPGRWRDEDDIRYQVAGDDITIRLATFGALLSETTYTLK